MERTCPPPEVVADGQEVLEKRVYGIKMLLRGRREGIPNRRRLAHLYQVQRLWEARRGATNAFAAVLASRELLLVVKRWLLHFFLRFPESSRAMIQESSLFFL
jgi:hypothetical protein